MSVNTNFETCLFLSSHKLAIGAYEKQSQKKFFYNEILNNNNFIQPSHELLNHFLEKNIFDIEKGLKNFVENVYLIIESDKFLTINISIKKKNYSDKITRDKLIHLLNEAKISCKKTIADNRITHMVIDNYLIDGENYSLFPNDLKCDSFSLDLRFICLGNDYIQNLENVLKKYQISIKHILNADYVKSIENENQGDILKMSLKIIDGYNENEVLIIPKLIKNKGFFERFFNFFS